MKIRSRVQTLSGTKKARVDIVGDVHGHARELFHLLVANGWRISGHDISGPEPIRASHPEKRTLLLAGDLINKGPESDRVLRLLLGLQEDQGCSSVIGNHEALLLRALSGMKSDNITKTQVSLSELKSLHPELMRRSLPTLKSLPHQIRIPMPSRHPMSGDGHLTLVHAACPEQVLDCSRKQSRNISVFGFPGQEDWVKSYRGKRWIVHGHTPAKDVLQCGRVLGIDTGLASGGRLTLLRLDDLRISSCNKDLKIISRTLQL